MTLGCIVHPAFRGICPHCRERRAKSRRLAGRQRRPLWVVASIGLLLAACAPDLNWRDWRTPEAGLAQLFPCKPVRQQRTVELGGRSVALVLQVCDAADVTWAVAHADLVDPAAVGPALQQLVASAHANLGAPMGAAAPARLAGATQPPGVARYRLQGQGRDGRLLQSAVLVVAHGTVVVQVTALGPRLVDDSVETFLGSVRVGP